MEKVDELIEKLAGHIIGILDTGNEATHEIEEKTKALAELITARSRMEGTYLQERSTTSGS